MWCQLSGDMKNCPPCCGLWLPCASAAYFLLIVASLAHVPGSIWAMVGSSLHVHDTAAVTRTSAVPSTGHLPGLSNTTSSGRVAQVQTESSRVATSVMPHLRHFPGRSSMTSSSPVIVQTYESGGRSTSPAGAFGFAGCASACEAAMRAETMTASPLVRMSPVPRSLVPSPEQSQLAPSPDASLFTNDTLAPCCDPHWHAPWPRSRSRPPQPKHSTRLTCGCGKAAP